MDKGNFTEALFIDIGGVLLTDGWNRGIRECAATAFNLKKDEMEERHHLTFDTYEVGKITLDEYLKRVIFYENRPFSLDEFKKFMFDQSKPYPEMINGIIQLRERYGLKVAVISNEGRELTEHRIRTFKLSGFIDFFISSCFVHLRKPDPEIYRLALDVAQVKPKNVVYIEDRPMFVQVAEGLGIPGIHHKDHATTFGQLSLMGLE
jgi:putative hydrolase of the HAD superfamily